jgi:hypothetical protein
MGRQYYNGPPKAGNEKMAVKKTTEAPAMTEADDNESWEASGKGWERVGTDNGECIDWEETPRFTGIYSGSGLVEKKATGETFNVLKFKSHNEDFFTWSTYQLEEAFADLPVGVEVRIIWKGKRDLDGGRSVNLFTVLARMDVAS